MAKKKKKKLRQMAGNGVAGRFAADVLGNVLGQFLADAMENYLGKNGGKKKLKKRLRKLTLQHN